MGHHFTLPKGSSVNPNADGVYPWPCKSEPKRTIKLMKDDILSRMPDGTYQLITGPGCFGIVLTDAEVTVIDRDLKMRMGS